MITKTYICDVCNKSVGEGDLCTVEVVIKSPQKGSNSYYRSEITRVEKHICKTCLTDKNIRVELPEGQKKEDFDKKNQVALEDKIIEFLQDLGVIFEE
ncbi:hypothetical protein DW1_1114 [Proteiniborus sp. DW1]|uniref:hypothetical protein n=1 Tax=Proteiniborus sp. DW1 TaxID=1889883 RepID=UPI00092DF029|nr:hypothetical protein [Proteiniborus sp. DW1]SCG82687.1 hypothetical protein DW1_1114 [Proteiniborus sp. DW1]